MANPYIVEPVALSLINKSSEVATGPAINAICDEPAMVWKTTAAGVQINVVSPAGPIDTIALLWSNLLSTNLVRIRAANSEANTVSAPLYDSSWVAAFSGTKPSPFRTKSVFVLPIAVTYSHWRIDIDLTNHPDGFLELSRIIMGMRTEWKRGINYGCSQLIVPQSVITSGAGYSDVDLYPSLPGWKVSFDWISEANWRDYFYPLLLRTSSGAPVLFIPQPDFPTTWQQEVVYGRLQQGISSELRFYDGWTTEFSIVGLSI